MSDSPETQDRKTISHTMLGTPIRIVVKRGSVVLDIRADEFIPPIPAKTGAVVAVEVAVGALQREYKLQDLSDEELIEKVIGVQGTYTVAVTHAEGKLFLGMPERVQRVLTLKDKRSVRTTSATATERTEKPAPTPEEEKQGLHHPAKGSACGYCNNGDALDSGGVCVSCGRHRSGDDIVFLSDEEFEAFRTAANVLG